ncbi:MAG: mandelate racemase/muconate lactonizing enzyme family protein [Oscillospiraceae bacterium]|nr:mandelate racemase/muconate lactonizing enzyme family protein [Oscillospiraceae bacterium]
MDYQSRYDETFKFTHAVIYSLYPIPMDAPFYDSTMGPFDTTKILYWMELYDEDGFMGQSPVGRNMLTDVLPHVLTGKRESYSEIYKRIYWLNRNYGFQSGSFADVGYFDRIMLDILSKRKGKPLHRYLGATRDWVHVYGSAHGINTTIDELLTEAQSIKDLGYTVYKMKVGTDWGRDKQTDADRVRLVRELIGSDAKLAVDANQVWTADEAMEFFELIEKYDICWYEEPVHSHEIVELEKICKLCPVPVSMGESLRSSHFFKVYADAGAKMLQGNEMFHGFDDWLKVRELAKERGLWFSGGGLPVHCAYMATSDEKCYQEHLKPTNDPVMRYMLIKPEEKNGKFIIPDTPGVPMTPDWDKLHGDNYVESINYYYPTENSNYRQI